MRRILALSLLLCAAAIAPHSSLAQTPSPSPAPPARQRLGVTVVQVKPEMARDFENLVRSEYNPALAKASAKWNDVWRTAQFGDAFEYTFVAPVENFAQFDGPGPLEKALGKEGPRPGTPRRAGWSTACAASSWRTTPS